jgi:hypothetical protein
MQFRGSIAPPTRPLPTLHARPHRPARMTQGHRGSLLLRRRELPSPFSCRFIPALRVGRIARPATPAPRHALRAPATDRGERSPAEAKRSQRATHARTLRSSTYPSLQAFCRPLRTSSRSWLVLSCPGMPTHDGTSMPELGGAQDLRTPPAGRPKPLACWLPATRAGAAQGRACRAFPPPLRPFAVRRSRGPVRVGESACRSGPAGRGRGVWETRTS